MTKATRPARDAFELLIQRYADGREICNCSHAYYNDRRVCESGCDANQLNAKIDVAEHVLAELGAK